VVGIARKLAPDERPEVVAVNGALGLAVFRGSALTSVLSFTAAGGRIIRIYFVRAPAKLSRAVRRGVAS
jgi:hypothetical protein